MTTEAEGYSVLEKLLGTTLENRELLRQVFIHRSYLNEHGEEGIESNERLEFLGDAVLELVVTNSLFKCFPAMPEGELTAIRSALVKREHLGEVARLLDLGIYLHLSKGEEQSGGDKKEYILANTVEALIGAIYLEKGYKAAEDMITKFILIDTQKVIDEKLYVDSKSKLQETAQEKLGITPHYSLIAESGPDHEKRFEMGVYFNDELVATGTGASKRKGEDQAAFKGLQAKEWL